MVRLLVTLRLQEPSLFSAPSREVRHDDWRAAQA